MGHWVLWEGDYLPDTRSVDSSPDHWYAAIRTQGHAQNFYSTGGCPVPVWVLTHCMLSEEILFTAEMCVTTL
jgi:hypothetical protein